MTKCKDVRITAGRYIIPFDTIDSTNKMAKTLAAEWVLTKSFIVTAEEQTLGRGRLDHKWECKKGDGLLMSIMLRPQNTPAEKLPLLVPFAAVAVCRAAEALGAQAKIKWPNDIVCGKNKLCGTMLETGLDKNGSRFVVIGIGMNVHGVPQGEGLHDITCLDDECGKKVAKDEVLNLIADGIDEAFEKLEKNDTAKLMQEYRRRCVTLGREIRVVSVGEEYKAVAADIDEDGCLIVEKDGEKRTVNSADVSVRGIMGYV